MKDLDLRNMTREQLLDLNKRVVAELNHRSAQIQIEAGAKLRVGDIVSFESRKTGRTVRGRVLAINLKSAKLAELDADGKEHPFLRWNVAPTLLTVVKPA
jgi:hypothetical protein